MNFRTNPFAHLLLIAAFTWGLCAGANAQTQITPGAPQPERRVIVHFDDKPIVVGIIKRLDDNVIEVEAEGGLRAFKLDEVSAITFVKLTPPPDGQPAPTSDSQGASPPPSEVSAPPTVSGPSSIPNAVPGPRQASGTDVHVRGYYRKDGTYVRPHTRSRPRRKN